jgi:ATPase subunit of ABC transporter with duplicated ATPase domains
VGSIAVGNLAWRLPGGDELFRDVGFKVGDGDRVAIVGANGAGKSTLLKLITGDLSPTAGTISVDGQIGVMHQLVGTADHPARTVYELLLSIAPGAAPPRGVPAGGRGGPVGRRTDGVRRRARGVG